MVGDNSHCNIAFFGTFLLYSGNFGNIVYRPVDKRENYIKRCIGLPGDTLQIIESMLFGYSMFPYIIYKQVAKWIFVVIIPLGLVANIPFAYFNYHSLYLVFLAIIIGGIYLILGKLIYIIFLKKYQSAGG